MNRTGSNWGQAPRTLDEAFGSRQGLEESPRRLRWHEIAWDIVVVAALTAALLNLGWWLPEILGM